MNYGRFDAKTGSSFAGWRSPDPLPIVLHVCRESRLEALKSYQAAFGSFFHGAKIYINFDIDTILFGAEIKNVLLADSEPSDYLLDVLLGGEYYGADDGEKIQRMVLDINESLYGRKAFCWDEIRLFTGLKELTIRAWDEDEMADDLMRHFRNTLGSVARNHPEWVIPEIKVISVISGDEWGVVKAPHVE
jgi:hypothetical protein